MKKGLNHGQKLHGERISSRRCSKKLPPRHEGETPLDDRRKGKLLYTAARQPEEGDLCVRGHPGNTALSKVLHHRGERNSKILHLQPKKRGRGGGDSFTPDGCPMKPLGTSSIEPKGENRSSSVSPIKPSTSGRREPLGRPSPPGPSEKSFLWSKALLQYLGGLHRS